MKIFERIIALFSRKKTFKFTEAGREAPIDIISRQYLEEIIEQLKREQEGEVDEK